MPRALKVCSTPGCPEITTSGRCDAHRAEAERARGGHELRGGGNSRAWRAARRTVLLRDPLCVCTDQAHGHGAQCIAPSSVADHHPRTKRELIAAGVRDPDHPRHLRGICKPCHDKHTGATSPGGWAAR